MREKNGQFKKGQSGNPKGRPKGARHLATVAAQNLLEGEAEALSRKAVEMALGGDSVALRLCLERILSTAKERPISGYQIPRIETSENVLSGLANVAEDLGEGRLLPTEAAAICNVYEQYRKHYEAVELEERIKKLEESINDKL